MHRLTSGGIKIVFNFLICACTLALSITVILFVQSFLVAEASMNDEVANIPLMSNGGEIYKLYKNCTGHPGITVCYDIWSCAKAICIAGKSLDIAHVAFKMGVPNDSCSETNEFLDNSDSPNAYLTQITKIIIAYSVSPVIILLWYVMMSIGIVSNVIRNSIIYRILIFIALSLFIAINWLFLVVIGIIETSPQYNWSNFIQNAMISSNTYVKIVIINELIIGAVGLVAIIIYPIKYDAIDEIVIGEYTISR